MTEHDLVFACTLTTATTTAGLIAVIPSGVVARGPASTSTSIGETLAGRCIPTAVNAGAGSGCGCGYSSGSEVLDPPLWVNPSNSNVACFTTACLMPLFGWAGALYTVGLGFLVGSGPLRKCASISRVA